MFRREILDGEPERYSVVGLWGSGNVVGDRSGLMDGRVTAYTMWDGHALFGPGRPGRIDKFPALVSVLDSRTFLERYSTLGDRCEVWSGDEVTGIGCEEACAALGEVCPTRDPRGCLEDCEVLPRVLTDCVASANSCFAEQECLARWARLSQR